MFIICATFKQIDPKSKLIKRSHSHSEYAKNDVSDLDSIIWFAYYYLRRYIVLNDSKKGFVSPFLFDIEITSKRGIRRYIFRETKSVEIFRFKIWDAIPKWYTIIDKETDRSIELETTITDLYPITDTIEFSTIEERKRKSPEIPTPMGGAVKRRK